MGLLDTLRDHVLALPDLAKFPVVIAVVVGIPPIARRARSPELIGLLLFGVLLGPLFAISAIVVGSLLASHTLLALSMVLRLRVMSFERIIVAIGATVISDTLSPVVFAICVSTYTTSFS